METTPITLPFSSPRIDLTVPQSLSERAPSTDHPVRLDSWANDGGSEAVVPRNSLRVLLGEDDALIGVLLAETLNQMGYDVCAVEAVEGNVVAAARLHKPDLMIIDASLGEGSGIAAVDAILRTGFVPHLFVSGDILRISRTRPDAVMLQKPFNETDLARAIALALDGAVPRPSLA